MDYICDIELRYFHVTKTHEVQTAVNQFKKKKMQGSNDFIIIFQAIHGADNFL